MLNTQSTILLNNGSSSSSSINSSGHSKVNSAGTHSSESSRNRGDGLSFNEINRKTLDKANKDEAESLKRLSQTNKHAEKSLEKSSSGIEHSNSGKLLPLSASDLNQYDEELSLIPEFTDDSVFSVGAVTVGNTDLNAGQSDLSLMNMSEAIISDPTLENIELDENALNSQLLEIDALEDSVKLIDSPEVESPIKPMPVEHQELPRIQMPPEWESGVSRTQLEVPPTTQSEQEALVISDGNTDGINSDDLLLFQKAKVLNDNTESKGRLLNNGGFENLTISRIKLGEAQSLSSTNAEAISSRLTPSEKQPSAQVQGINSAMFSKNDMAKSAISDNQSSDKLKLSGLSKSLIETVHSDVKLPTHPRVNEASGVTPANTVANPILSNPVELSTVEAKGNPTSSSPTLNGMTEPLQIYSKHWQQNVGRHVQWMQQAGVNSAEIQLDPAELGPITIKISAQGGDTQVSIQAAHNQTRELLEQNQQRLKDLMEQNGMNLSQFDVSDDGSKEQSSQSDELTAGERHADIESADDAAQLQPKVGHITLSGLDYFV